MRCGHSRSAIQHKSLRPKIARSDHKCSPEILAVSLQSTERDRWPPSSDPSTRLDERCFDQELPLVPARERSYSVGDTTATEKKREKPRRQQIDKV